jgi:hypothetical protein
MTIQERIETFGILRNYLSAIDAETFRELAENARNENPWFTEQNIKLAFAGIIKYLHPNDLRRWVAPYSLTSIIQKKIALVMAGNIPLVGFHDLLAVLISGHSALIKLSSKDTVLIKFIAKKLEEINPRFGSCIAFGDQLKGFDAVIATGSDNSARYFHYYFDKYPNIIRKNRTSCAVLTGKETAAELHLLGGDIFTYFGLGCRNVSKIYVPKQYDLTLLLPQWNAYSSIIHHHKYHNNYDYQKSILLINRIPFLETEFVLLQESEKLVSPISVVYFERYQDEGSLALRLLETKEKIQCVVGNTTSASVPFGQAQSPMVWDYADQVDTLKFLQNLNTL